MNYFKNAISPLHPLDSRRRAGALTALAAVLVGVVLAGCGGSGETSTITVGNENKADNSLITAGNPEVPKTPTTGPLASKPTVSAGKPPPPSELQTREIVTGTGTEAKKGSTVYVNYVGVLFKTGKEFDSSWSRNEPFTFVVGAGQVIPGWDKGIVGMKVGGRRELIIPAKEAYGKTGSEPKIPPNEALIFVVDLLSAKG